MTEKQRLIEEGTKSTVKAVVANVSGTIHFYGSQWLAFGVDLHFRMGEFCSHGVMSSPYMSDSEVSLLIYVDRRLGLFVI